MVLGHNGKVYQLFRAVVVEGVRVAHRAVVHIAGLETLFGVVIAEVALAADDVDNL